MKNKVKELILLGMKNKDIAKELNITSSLVSYYRSKIFGRKIKKVKEEGMRERRLRITGLSRDLLTAAIAKFLRKRQNAKQGGIEFSITFDDIIWNTVCPILGIKLNYFADVISPASVSFDRIDPTKGYIKGNVNIISFRANNLKSNGSKEEFALLLEYLNKL